MQQVRPTGLTDAEAAARLAEVGPNVAPREPPPTLLRRVARQLREPLVALLLAAAAASAFVLGELSEASVILVVVVLDVVIAVVQERRSDVAMASLEDLHAPNAHVRRSGRTLSVPAEEVVPGDLVEVAAGDRVPADLRLVTSTALAVDEAMLTGESVAAEKDAADAAVAGVDDLDDPGRLYAGTLVVRGRGAGTVVATAADTRLGGIAAMLHVSQSTPLERELRVLGGRMAAGALVLGTLLGILVAVRGGGDRGALGDGLLAAVALAVAAIPEGLPAATTAALALGAQRMARRGAIVRNLPAIEALGSTSVLCVDKTGTLTTGQLTLEEARPVPGREEALWAAAVRANDAGDGGSDPVDVAIVRAAEARGIDLPNGRQLADAPFDADTRLAVAVHEGRDGPELSVKGAPEAVLARCSPGADATEVAAAVGELVARGRRVLVVADAPTGDLDATGLRPLGVLSFVDPLRPSTADVVAACRSAGMRLVMVTGDHADTATRVADEVGLAPGLTVSGVDLAGADADDRITRLAEARVLARVDPRVKVELVRAHRSQGEVVAMTGDGVNDAPALRLADVGVAVAGSAGTDVAREAADVVVTSGDLRVLVDAVREGRRIYRNVASLVGYLVAGNLSEILVVMAGLLLLPALDVPLLPTQLLWVNLVTDGLPAIAIGVDRPVGDVLLQAPRRAADGLLGGGKLRSLGGRAAAIALVVLVSARLAEDRGWADDVVRSQLLTTLVFAHLALVYVARSERRTLEPGWSRNRALLATVGGSVILHAALLLVPATRDWLELGALPPSGWLTAIVGAAASVVAIDLARAWARRTP